MEDLDALLADLQVTSPTRCPVLLTDGPESSEMSEQRPTPPPYSAQTALTSADADPGDVTADRTHLYSTVKKCSPPAVPVSVGGGICELDRLLNELNATQFNITDEIMSQFPPREKSITEIPDERRALSASSATLELDRLMASLSDFHKQNTVVTALGHKWHPEHFVCAHCKSLIGTTNFFEKEGRPYCERDYFSLYAPRCALCDLPILQNLVTALGRTWHPEHFCCKICKKTIGEEGFHEKDNVPYCSYDYYHLFGTVCAGCSEPVKESYISALNGLWHPQCFVCHVCRSPFVNGSFFENDGLPLCETHYHSCRGSLCAGCDQPITGRCVTAMGRKFHPQHLSCTFCLRQLNKGTFREQEGKPYCQACFARLYG
ncbi:transforming growth factor beta-1-induced transcript 1 protein isoform X2 [Dendrobates tinctorius]|uniref:transforming growth factor beta-1-induced transcript 1 protein isoform X2 n=1 Tax=Dendrobates tinctorius TaxID=92724 RepID=UPI003CC9F664